MARKKKKEVEDKINDKIDILKTDEVGEKAIEKEELIEEEPIEEIKMTKVKIYNVEKKAFLANVFGIPKRIYFDLAFKDLEYLHDNLQSYKNKMLRIYYIGNPSDMRNVRILPIKSLEDIGNRF